MKTVESDSHGVPSHLRLAFFGRGDFATFMQGDRVNRVLGNVQAGPAPSDVNGFLELAALQQFIEAGMFTAEAESILGTRSEVVIGQLRSTVGRFFGSVDDATVVEDLAGDIGWQHRDDLLDLLGRHGAFRRCSAASMLTALQNAGFGLGDVLADRLLVRAYGVELREWLLGDPMNAEHVVRKQLGVVSSRAIHLPAQFTSDDARSLLRAYIEAPDAHLDVVQLITSAQITTGGVVDVHLKRDAKRAHKSLTAQLFETTKGLSTGVEVMVDSEQTEPVDLALDDMILKYSYSRSWLEQTTEPASVMNNLMYVFVFVTDRLCLTMPARQSNLGLVDSLFTTRGREDYPATSFFRLNEAASLLQMNMYDQFLRSKGIELESVFAWVFDEHMGEEHGIRSFQYSTSTPAAPYLQRCTHLLVQMESIAKQYRLYVTTGAVEGDLLALAPDQVLYRSLPTLIDGKYVYATRDVDVQNVLNLLFSNQSGLGYIDEDLHESTLAELLTGHDVLREQFHDHQKPQIDYLTSRGVLAADDVRVSIASSAQFLVLREIFECATASYHHFKPRHRAAVDELIARGWLVRKSSLLSEPEAGYFNYVLNQVDYADGPNLRNRYLHASHADQSDETEHYRSYLVILKMVAALIIKINDDLWIRAVELADEPAPSRCAPG